MKLSRAALEAVEETGIDPADDLARLRAGLTIPELLAECLNGADDDRVEGWLDYVAALEAVVS